MFDFHIADNNGYPHYNEGGNWVAVKLLLEGKYIIYEYPSLFDDDTITCYSIYEYGVDIGSAKELVWGRYNEFKKKLDEINIDINKLKFRDDKKNSTHS